LVRTPTDAAPYLAGLLPTIARLINEIRAHLRRTVASIPVSIPPVVLHAVRSHVTHFCRGPPEVQAPPISSSRLHLLWLGHLTARLRAVHPQGDVKAPEKADVFDTPHLSAQARQPFGVGRITGQPRMKAMPRAPGRVEEPSHDPVIDWNMVRVLAGEQLARRHPTDAVNCEQRPPQEMRWLPDW
jgi:hypothetical protein